MSGAASSVYRNTYTSEKFIYKFVKNFKYGQIKNKGEDVQKTDDQILIRNSFEYVLSTISSLMVNVNFQSQFASGYDITGDERARISKFLCTSIHHTKI